MKRLTLLAIPLIFLGSCTKDFGWLKQEIFNKVKDSLLSPNFSLSAIRGVNWADPRDNFTDDFVVPSGLSSADNYAATKSKADNILNAFQQRGVNTVRLPVNPSSVLGSWWASYTGAIDRATQRGMRVIVAYWEGNSSRDGRVDNTTEFWNMWQAIVNKYKSDSSVYFEVFNEPHGYSLGSLTDLYSEWLGKFPNVPRGRIFLDGVGYAQDVNGVGNDSRFNGCMLSYHNYTWFDNGKTTIADWEGAIFSIAYPERTVMTEFGIPMTNGKDYVSPPASDREIAYFQGLTAQARERGMGSIYWPGLRDGDSYSLLTLTGTTLTTNNDAGLQRLQFGWGIGQAQPFYASFDSTAYYSIICRNSNKGLDVNGSSTADGGAIIQWDFWGGINQQWRLVSQGNGFFTIVNRNSGKVLDLRDGSPAWGTDIVQWTDNDSTSQQWQITDIGFGYFEIINRKSGISLDVNGSSTNNGEKIIEWPQNFGRNQQWQIVRL